MTKIKIAIIQEWLVTVGGSDKVVRAIKDVFPDADIFALVANKETCDELGFDYKTIYTSFIQKLPFAKSGNHRAYLPLFPIAIEQFDLSEYDVIISSSHSAAKGVITNNNQLHICYCHSPVRYAWDLYHSYLKEAGLKRGIRGLFAKYILHRFRIWDLASSFRVDFFISNSNYIAKRIRKVYRRDATTIYPNIDVERFKLNAGPRDDFYLACSRLVPYKKISLIAEAFSEMPDKKLVIIGDGPEYKQIESKAAPNISLKGFMPFNEMVSFMQKTKAFVFAADEDFGMVPVEAQACGTPVIAFGKGGSLETVKHKITGLHFKHQSISSIKEAVTEFENNSHIFDAKIIRLHAETFSESRFKNEILNYVNTKWEEFNK